MAYIPTFGDWNAVYQMYGYQAGNAMQQQGIPLNQVGQYVNQQLGQTATYGPGGMFPGELGAGNVSSIQNDPQVVGPEGISQTLSGLIQFGQGGGGQPQAPPNPYNTGLVGNPMYGLSQLGAAALQQPMIVNPNPSQNQINAQSGVYSGPQNPQISGTKPVTAPAGPWNNTPGIFGGPAQQPPASGMGPGTGPSNLNVNWPYGATGWGGNQQGKAVATPPPAPNISLPSSGIGVPPSAPGMGSTSPGAPRAGIGIGGPPVNYAPGSTTPGTSTGAIALGDAGIPPSTVKIHSGGSVPGQGNTDTVPAMLTPGEYVINKQAVQAIGQDKLNQLNRAGGGKVPQLGDGFFGGVQHKADGGTVQDPAAIQYALGLLPQAERQMLNQSGGISGGMSVNPLVMKAKQDFDNLVQQYGRGAGLKPTPESDTGRVGVYGPNPTTNHPQQPSQVNQQQAQQIQTTQTAQQPQGPQTGFGSWFNPKAWAHPYQGAQGQGPYMANNFGQQQPQQQQPQQQQAAQQGQPQQVGPPNLSQSGPGQPYYGNPNRLQVGPEAPAAPTTPAGTPMPYTAPQTGGGPGAGGYWPAGSTVYPGQYVIGPNQPGSAPGTSTGDILATGAQATNYPTADAGAGGPSGMSVAGGVAGGIGSALGSLAQGFQNAAKASWHWINPGNWANPNQYSQEQLASYNRYQQGFQQDQVENA